MSIDFECRIFKLIKYSLVSGAAGCYITRKESFKSN